MRLTYPNNQSYVRRLLTDALGFLIDKIPSLKAGEALLIGDFFVIPSIICIDECKTLPSLNDIPYWKLWKDEWKNLYIIELKN